MSAPYTTDDAIRARLGPERTLALLDRDDDGDEDSGEASTGNVAPVDDAIRWADRRIEGALGTKYVVPFANLDDTPDQVQELSCDGAIAYLYEWLAPGSDDAKKWRKDFDDALKAYSKGEWAVIGATPIGSDSPTAARSVRYESGGLVFSGKADDDYSSTDTSDRFPI